MSEQTLSPKIVRRLFRYDAQRGLLIWLDRPVEDFPHDRAMSWWNTKFSGEVAGYINQQNGRRVIRIMMDGISSNYLAYRLIWALHHGSWPSETIDHIDGDQANDQIENLRDVPFAENCKNLAIQSNNRSGVRGVNWDRKKQKWQARIQVTGHEFWLGYFDTLDEAKAIRKAAEVEYRFHRNHGRPGKQQRHERPEVAA